MELTYIKNNAHYKQLIFISAVIPNGEQLGEWLFKNHTYQSLSYKDIPSTSKHIAILGNNADLDFYKLSDFSSRDYYVQNSIKKKNIPTKGGKKSKKFFPDDGRDVALYYADLLIPNGSLAIYFGTRKRIDGSSLSKIKIQKRTYARKRHDAPNRQNDRIRQCKQRRFERIHFFKCIPREKEYCTNHSKITYQQKLRAYRKHFDSRHQVKHEGQFA